MAPPTPQGISHEIELVELAISRGILLLMKRFPIYITLSILLLFVPSVYAEGINAGFPSQPLWVSKTNATAGETISLFTAVYNGDNEKLLGTVAFTVDGERVGGKDIAIEGGASELISVEWRAIAGEHSIAAMIEGTSIAIAQKETAAITIIVAEAPPTPLRDAATAASEILAGATRAAAPVISNAANTTYGLVESLRLDAISRLENMATNTTSSQENLATPSIAGTSTSAVTGFSESASSTPSALSQMGKVAATVALVAIKSRALFYPLFILSLFVILYLLFRWATKRPRVRY